MNNKSLSELHNILMVPLRRNLLLQLWEHKHQTFEDLALNLQQDRPQLERELKFLQKPCLQKEQVIEKEESIYRLTHKGQYAVEKMLIYPQLETENFTNLCFPIKPLKR